MIKLYKMIKRFSEIRMTDVSICGGKGASLGEMMNAGLPIPNGFVLTTKAYGIDSKEWEEEVLEAFDKLDTRFVAVRSSGTKEDGIDDSFAGQFDTYLFVTRDNLIKKIKECHDSVNSERIVSYCEYKGIDIKSIKVAVVVQKMVNSESAGVCFTVNPISGESDEVMIEAGFGVGEAVVSGMITPDNYVVDMTTGSVEKNISKQEKKLVLDDMGGTNEVEIDLQDQTSQKLSDEHILKLSEFAKKIEKHYGKPMDTEWAVENGELFILQARPITTELKHNIYDEVAAERKSEDWFLMEEVKGARPFILSGRGRKLTERYNEEFNLPIEDVMVYKDNILFLYVKHHQLYLTAKAMLQKSLSDVNFLPSISQRNRKIQNDTFAYCDELEKINLKEKTDQELMQLFAKYMEQLEIMITIGRVDCILEFENEMFSTTLRNYLAKRIKEKGLQLNVAEVFSTFTIPVEKTRGILQEESLQAIANEIKKDPKALSFFLENSLETIENGIETMYPTINTQLEDHTKKFNWYFYMYEGPARNKSNFIAELKQLLSSKQPAQTENVNLVEAKAELIKKLDINDDYQKLLKSAEEMVFNKDLRKHALYRMSYVGLNIFQEVAQRCNISVEEAWNLTPREIQDLTLDDIKNLDLKSRDKGMMMWFYKGGHETDLDPNNANKFMDDVAEKNKLTGNITTLQGSCAYQGKIVGKVMIVDSPEDMKKFKEGEILVAHQTDPDILPAMKLAAAFVTDLGGITCHAAIVSREMKKPCIVGTKFATQVLKDGDLVEVDADNGIVKILQ